MNGQDSMSPIKPTTPIEGFSSDRSLDEPQDTEFKKNNHELYN